LCTIQTVRTQSSQGSRYHATGATTARNMHIFGRTTSHRGWQVSGCFRSCHCVCDHQVDVTKAQSLTDNRMNSPEARSATGLRLRPHMSRIYSHGLPKCHCSALTPEQHSNYGICAGRLIGCHETASGHHIAFIAGACYVQHFQACQQSAVGEC
jgi:hypothetical protein